MVVPEAATLRLSKPYGNPSSLSSSPYHSYLYQNRFQDQRMLGLNPHISACHPFQSMFPGKSKSTFLFPPATTTPKSWCSNWVMIILNLKDYMLQIFRQPWRRPTITYLRPHHRLRHLRGPRRHLHRCRLLEYPLGSGQPHTHCKMSRLICGHWSGITFQSKFDVFAFFPTQ